MRPLVLSALSLLACSLTMSAATISYTGTGQFSNITNCTGGSPTCSVSSVSGGTNNQLNMSGYSASFPYSPSTLTAVTTTNSVILTAPTTLTLGELDWTNRATYGTDTNFNATYTFRLSFTSPTTTSDTQAFALNLLQTTNPTGDEVLYMSNSTLAGLGPFNLNGITMSNLRFVLASGTAGSYSNGTWKDPEGSTSKVLIVADFAPAATPEPSSLALLGTGLLGIAGVARRKFQV